MNERRTQRRQDKRSARGIALVQGWYFLFTGAWPLFHMSSFMWVTGPKTDLWLVRLVGALTVVLGVVLLRQRREPVPQRSNSALTGGAAALAFLLVDLVHVAQGVIGPVYLIDAAIELLFLLAWWSVMVSRV
jgi:hypothetical protein